MSTQRTVPSLVIAESKNEGQLSQLREEFTAAIHEMEQSCSNQEYIFIYDKYVQLMKRVQNVSVVDFKDTADYESFSNLVQYRSGEADRQIYEAAQEELLLIFSRNIINAITDMRDLISEYSLI